MQVKNFFSEAAGDLPGGSMFAEISRHRQLVNWKVMYLAWIIENRVYGISTEPQMNSSQTLRVKKPRHHCLSTTSFLSLHEMLSEAPKKKNAKHFTTIWRKECIGMHLSAPFWVNTVRGSNSAKGVSFMKHTSWTEQLFLITQFVARCNNVLFLNHISWSKDSSDVEFVTFIFKQNHAD